ncbi:hypothetical protein [Selenomonas ruminantium]|jgi:hypothetical protein|uniref:Uncharacterized protein n=1 Tax=Selenomonas ruminantium TaxID=971 RepID=A0A927ZT21_SELRU|nr:hypothetical protein [Selenomonas ruminantium]MBE6093098.1 hypothetical protein [Selenomonas ruminantium]MBR1696344.1 hypothetical protein [Selenomonas sp.]
MTNEEADLLIEIAKRMRKNLLELPEPGHKEFYKAVSLADTKKFTIQMFRGNSRRDKYQIALLYKKNFVLMRVDTGATGIHYNTDKSIIPPNTPHLHYYDEHISHENKCHDAIVLPDRFTNPADAIQLLQDFLKYINIIDMAEIQIIQQGGLPYGQHK